MVVAVNRQPLCNVAVLPDMHTTPGIDEQIASQDRPVTDMKSFRETDLKPFVQFRTELDVIQFRSLKLSLDDQLPDLLYQ